MTRTVSHTLPNRIASREASPGCSRDSKAVAEKAERDLRAAVAVRSTARHAIALVATCLLLSVTAGARADDEFDKTLMRIERVPSFYARMSEAA